MPQVLVNDISLNNLNLNDLKVGLAYRLDYSVLPWNADNKLVSFSAKEGYESIVKIERNIMTGLAQDVCFITGFSNDGSFQKDFKITFRNITQEELNQLSSETIYQITVAENVSVENIEKEHLNAVKEINAVTRTAIENITKFSAEAKISLDGKISGLEEIIDNFLNEALNDIEVNKNQALVDIENNKNASILALTQEAQTLNEGMDNKSLELMSLLDNYYVYLAGRLTTLQNDVIKNIDLKKDEVLAAIEGATDEAINGISTYFNGLIIGSSMKISVAAKSNSVGTGPIIVDGIQTAIGDLILVDQTEEKQYNGLYQITSENLPWTRAEGYNTVETLNTKMVLIVNGILHNGQVFYTLVTDIHKPLGQSDIEIIYYNVGMEEAPEDGKFYTRHNEEWIEMPFASREEIGAIRIGQTMNIDPVTGLVNVNTATSNNLGVMKPGIGTAVDINGNLNSTTYKGTDKQIIVTPVPGKLESIISTPQNIDKDADVDFNRVILRREESLFDNEAITRAEAVKMLNDIIVKTNVRVFTETKQTGTPIIDGIQTAIGDYILVGATPAHKDNGVWEITSGGVWVRPGILDELAEIDNSVLLVLVGTANAGKKFTLSMEKDTIVGTDPIEVTEVNLGTSFSDVPVDGKLYGRKDASWYELKYGFTSNTFLEGKYIEKIFGAPYGGTVQQIGNKLKGYLYLDTESNSFYICSEANDDVNVENNFIWRCVSNSSLELTLDGIDLLKRFQGGNFIEKTCFYFGTPATIGGSTSINEAVEIYKNYDIIVFGKNYQETGNANYSSTAQLINAIRASYPYIKIFGAIDVGASAGTDNLSIAQINAKIELWKNLKIYGIYLDNFGYDYSVNRTRQNDIINKCRTLELQVFVNSTLDSYIYSKENIVVNSFNGNQSLLPCLLNSKDYALYYGNTYTVSGSETVAQTRLITNRAYDYYFKIQTEYSDTYYNQFKVKTVSLDFFKATNEASGVNDIYRTFSLLTSKILNINGVAFTDETLGTNVNLFFKTWDLPVLNLTEKAGELHSVKTTVDGSGPLTFSALINNSRWISDLTNKTITRDNTLINNPWYDNNKLNQTKPDKTIRMIAGLGMVGGGDLGSDRTFDIVSANSGIAVNAHNIELKPGTTTAIGGLKVDGVTLSVDSEGLVKVTDNKYVTCSGISIPASTDLNTFKTYGNYSSVSNTNAATLINAPFGGNAFTLVVAGIGPGTYITQFATQYSDGAMKYRVTVNGGTTWSAWIDIMNKTSSDATYVKKAGDTITSPLTISTTTDGIILNGTSGDHGIVLCNTNTTTYPQTRIFKSEGAPGFYLRTLTASSTYKDIIRHSYSNNVVYYAGGTFDGAIVATGDITAFSDKKLKKNIKQIKYEKLNEINLYEYDRIDTKKHEVGIIAQEIEKIVPEVVKTNENGYKSVDYSKLSVIIGLHSLGEIEVLQEENKLLKDKLSSIEELLKKLGGL